MSDQNAQLNEYLTDSRQQGVLSDTSGFTLDQLKAREKLSRYQFSDPGFWLVKMVQAAVAAGASEVKISFGRRKVAVRFTPAARWSAEEIYRTVISEADSQERALSHLVAGIRAVSCTLAESTKWSVGDSSVSLDSGGSHLASCTPTREFLLETTRPPRPFPWSKVLSSPLQHLLRQTLDDWTAVAQRCWSSPIPVLLDGRPLRQGYDAVPEAKLHDQSVGRRATRMNRSIASRTLSCTPGRPLLPMPAQTHDEVRICSEFSTFDTFLRWAPSSIPAHGVVTFHSSAVVAPAVVFVLDGAVLEHRLLYPLVRYCQGTSVLKRPLLVPRFIFGVEPKELDLSGMAVRDVDEVQLFQASCEQSTELVHLVRAHLSKYRARAIDEEGLIKQGLDALEAMLQL